MQGATAETDLSVDYINTLPDCPRCIGGRLLPDHRVENNFCINCGYQHEKAERQPHYIKATKLISDNAWLKKQALKEELSWAIPKPLPKPIDKCIGVGIF